MKISSSKHLPIQNGTSLSSTSFGRVQNQEVMEPNRHFG